MSGDGTIVRNRHLRAADICARGARHWFVQHGFSWDDFLDNGISADALDATGDSFAHIVTAIARAEQHNG